MSTFGCIGWMALGRAIGGIIDFTRRVIAFEQGREREQQEHGKARW